MTHALYSRFVLTCKNRQHHRRHHVVHENGEQKIIVVQHAIAIVAGADEEPAEESGDDDVHRYPQMRQRLITFTFDDSAPQQHFQLMKLADFVDFDSLIGNRMFLPELLHFHDPVRVLEPR